MESKVATKWFFENNTTVNPNEFFYINYISYITKHKRDDMPTGFSIGIGFVFSEESVKILRINLHNRLNFYLHINIC